MSRKPQEPVGAKRDFVKSTEASAIARAIASVIGSEAAPTPQAVAIEIRDGRGPVCEPGSSGAGWPPDAPQIDHTHVDSTAPWWTEGHAARAAAADATRSQKLCAYHAAAGHGTPKEKAAAADAGAPSLTFDVSAGPSLQSNTPRIR